MATIYIIRTNGVELENTYTVKASALKEAEMISDAAVLRNSGDLIEVVTQARGKVVYSFRNNVDVTRTDNVTIQGAHVEVEDAHGHMAEQTAWMTQEGVCIGLCAIGTGCAHCDEQYGPEASQMDAESVCTATDDNPDCLHCERVAMDAQTDRDNITELRNAMEESSMAIQTVATVNVVQAWAGSNGMNHYHAPACRDIEREGKRWGIRAEHGNMGRYEFSFSSVADIIEHEYSDCNNGDAWDMIHHANDDYDGLKIMSCLRDSLPLGAIQGMPVEFKGGRWTLGDAPLDSERCTVCEVYGNVADNSTDIDGKHVCGYCVDNGRSVATLNTHSLTFYVETEGKGNCYECSDCGAINNRAAFAETPCVGGGGFVETESTDDYAIVSRLTTGAGFHTVEDSRNATPAHTVATGTTHHTTDTDGNTWERFDHVLSVGDVVKIIGEQGVYEVHCLIPGLPVVYVLGTTGEPFPVPATDVYAL